jgi:hypothetical protein
MYRVVTLRASGEPIFFCNTNKSSVPSTSNKPRKTNTEEMDKFELTKLIHSFAQILCARLWISYELKDKCLIFITFKRSPLYLAHPQKEYLKLDYEVFSIF